MGHGGRVAPLSHRVGPRALRSLVVVAAALAGCDGSLESSRPTTSTDATRSRDGASRATGGGAALSGSSGSPRERFLGVQAAGPTLTVTGSDGLAVTRYRWLLEEDATHHVTAGSATHVGPALEFHRSYMPVVAAGDETTPPSTATIDSSKHYFLSVLPTADYSNGGVPVMPGQTQVSIVVNRNPLPLAQVSVFVFEDVASINGAADLPAEQALAGFAVSLEDAGGRFGQNGGPQFMDYFGNPIGTTYNPDGSVQALGKGFVLTGADGMAVIKNLAPGKFGVNVVPPAGLGWQQTTTIEGTQINDSWVMAGERSFMTEFGKPSPHVSVGFLRQMNDTTVLRGAYRLRGHALNHHLGRPPAFSQASPGHVLTNVWVGVNVGTQGVFAAPADPDTGAFEIAGVAPGTYELVFFDRYLNNIIAFQTVSLSLDGGIATLFGLRSQIPPPQNGVFELGDVAIDLWFANVFNHVYFDANQNGFPDEGEVGMPEQNVNLRFRDGSIYQSMPTDVFGWSPFERVFPFFNWLVVEVDYTRFKATGATVVVDQGGPVPAGAGMTLPSLDRLNPQPQPDNAGLPYRTELGPVLVEGVQTFAGQTNVVYWGKAPYAPDENGGISGIVYYASTRAEDDPRYAAGDPWEPGVPRVPAHLYLDADENGVIDDLDGDGGPTLADVDQHPFGWRDGTAPMGAEDLDRNGNGRFDAGDAVQIAASDSWDDSAPEGCPGDPADPFFQDGKCYDGMRNWNQVRPAVFDGGYAFMTYHQGGIASGSAETTLPAGVYIVEVVPRAGYELVKEEDKNVDFGDTFGPDPQLLLPPCVGDAHLVPAELDLFPGVQSRFAGQTRPRCDRKQVVLSPGQNAAADFFVFTKAPIAAHFAGIIGNDLANEFDPQNPAFGEKTSPPFVPVALRDHLGRELTRVYSDRYGFYNGLVPSTYSANVPNPSGYSPAMYAVCINDPGPITDPVNPDRQIIDPSWRKEYTHACYQFQFMPGTTTYLDTPVLPVAAWAGKFTYPLDCELGDGAPIIAWVDGAQGGPYVPSATQRTISIYAQGDTTVTNPAYDGSNAPTIVRDFGFGGLPGSVTVTTGGVTSTLVINEWASDRILATVPATVQTGQLTVTRGDNGQRTAVGVTLTVGPGAGQVFHVSPSSDPAARPVQDAIDAASPGDLILLAPGRYDELVIMYKPVRLQGAGAWSTVINAITTPTTRVNEWQDRINALVATGAVDLLPSQVVAQTRFPDTGPLVNEQGPGIIVLARQGQAGGARIDGLTVVGANNGGGILVNAYTRNLTISNNRLASNSGAFGGGIRVGEPSSLIGVGEPTDADNDGVRILYNHIAENGTTGGGGGGVALYTGADNYEIRGNHVCGNFTVGSGAGIGHQGLSRNGVIAQNTIVFNQSFHQTVNQDSGGGVAIQGLPPVGGTLSAGSGTVTIDKNLILGNQAGAGDGGGIRIAWVNGADVVARPFDRTRWHRVDVFNNVIVNNAAGLAGAGISIEDAALVNIIHDTVAHNDSTGTAGTIYNAALGTSTPQPAGIISRPYSAALRAALVRARFAGAFPNPALRNSIVWENRSFYFSMAANGGTGGLLPDVAAGQPPVYVDLGVVGGAAGARLNPQNCTLTSAVGYAATNISLDPRFLREYFNGGPLELVLTGRMGIMPTAAAVDEGGNFIDVRIDPLTLFNPATGARIGDYHISGTSPARNRANGLYNLLFAQLRRDFDDTPRGLIFNIDMGADEIP